MILEASGIFYGVLAMAAWGIADYFAAIAARKSGSFSTFFLTQIISLIVYLLIFFAVPFKPGVSQGILLTSIIAGLLMIVAYAAFYKSLEVGKVAIGTSISSCWALLTVFIAYFFFKEPLSNVHFAGIGFAILGIFLTSVKSKDFMLLKSKPASAEKGVLLGIIALVGWGIAFALIDILVANTDWFHAILFIKISTVIFTLPYVFVKRPVVSFRNVTSLLIIVGILETVAYLALGFGFSVGSSTLVAPVASTYPVVAVILARLFLNEKLEKNQYLGISFVILGVIILAL